MGTAPADRDRAFALWIVQTVAHAVIHNGTVERPRELASGRLGEELTRLLVAYVRPLR